MNNFRFNKILWKTVIFLTLLASAWGIINPNIYDSVFAVQFIPGALPQDILTVLVCLLLLAIISKSKANSLKHHAVILGVIGSIWYLYAIFSLERVYNFAYYLYLAIFSLSFWSIFYSTLSLRKENLLNISISKKINTISAFFSLSIASLFSLLWIAALFPLLQNGDRTDFLYSIYILDLCFVMPGFVLTAILSLKKNVYGIFFTPVIYILGIFVIFPLGLAEIAKPYHNQEINIPSMIFAFVLAAAFLGMSIIQLKNQKIRK